ncbi:MAG: exodeoxyribonuclease VII small subunit [Methanosaeta sp. PtaU1.Bin060]|jgi:exodeoxyribonuclease VII small subunit|nr:MAG: exodeoxyribonuclease VII small subunit [Methanosaeta sp. PtaU1.Bin060]
MEDQKYFNNIHRIEEIISQIDAGKLPPDEAKKLYETGRALIEECEAILNGYAGSIEEISINASGP